MIRMDTRVSSTPAERFRVITSKDIHWDNFRNVRS